MTNGDLELNDEQRSEGDFTDLEEFRSPKAKWIDFLVRKTPVKMPGKVLSKIYTNVSRLEGGPFFSPSIRDWLMRDYRVLVGAYSYGPCLTPSAFPPGVVVGRYVSIAAGVRISLQNKPTNRLAMHPLFYESSEYAKSGMVYDSPLVIGHDAWIGDSALILPGCKRIGIGAVIGGGAVVTRDVPDFAIVGGNPARTIRYRFDEEVRTRILTTKWWLRSYVALSADVEKMALSLETSDHPLLSGGDGFTL